MKQQRQFTTGDILLSRTSKAIVREKGYLHLETEMDYLTLDASEAARLADFLLDQSEYPHLAERLEKIQHYVLQGEISKQALYAALFEIMLKFLPHDLLTQVHDILGIACQDRTELQA